ASAAPDAATVLRQVLDTYRGMRSYSDRATKTRIERKGSQTEKTTLEERFAYQAPNRFMLQMARGQNSLIIASDGQFTRLYNPGKLAMQSTPSPVALAGSNAFFEELTLSLEYDALALFVRQDIGEGAPTGLIADSLDGRPVYRLQLTEP